ncbi:MAG TPA: glycoside hydrolase family 2 TIM barrel-domain containing protein, partial [Verrucomicrobiae bacterium]
MTKINLLSARFARNGFTSLVGWLGLIFCLAGGIARPASEPLVAPQSANPGSNRTTELFDFDWKYHAGDGVRPELPDYDDHDWQTVQLPHDATIGAAPVNGGGKSGRWNGFMPRNCGWYRKSFTLAQPLGMDHMVIEFEGVYRDAEVWLNGHHLGRWLNGFLDFSIDLTDQLQPGTNILAVRYDNRFTNSSRWYMGEGIYRHVWLKRFAPVHVAEDGQFITAGDLGSSSATIRIESEIRNEWRAATNVDVTVDVLAPDGSQVGQVRGVTWVPPQSVQRLVLTTSIKAPQLWDVTNPCLYRAQTTLRVGGQIRDRCTETFGLRQLSFSPAHGLLLNGRKVFLQGVNLHDDLPGVGTAAFDRAIDRRLETLKSLGVNAVRLAHNPHARHFLDACDRLGLLVFDEAYDKWSEQYYGPGAHFAELWPADLAAFMRRDRNHPSVFIWSVGNEPLGQQLAGPDTADGALLERMLTLARAWDPTRPATAALYPARQDGIKWNQKGYGQSAPHSLAFLPEVASVNYQSGFFA